MPYVIKVSDNRILSLAKTNINTFYRLWFNGFSCGQAEIEVFTACNYTWILYSVEIIKWKCMSRLKDFAPALKHIADIIERGIREHPELSVGMQTEGIEVINDLWIKRY